MSGAVIFLLVVPAVFFFVSKMADKFIGFSQLLAQPLNVIVSIPLIICGIWFALGSIHAQFTIGWGTPLPMVPTQKLVVSGPYAYCRNPMILGAAVLYIGLGILVNSLSWIVIFILALLVPVLIYIKLIEEKELEARFGGQYLTYKKNTPFLIPGVR